MVRQETWEALTCP